MKNKYAELVIKKGINLQQGQTLVISTPIECAYFANLLAEQAYLNGAKDVVMNYNDENFAKINLTYIDKKELETFPDWRKQFYDSYANNGAAFVSIYAEDPEIFKDIDSEKLVIASKARANALKNYRKRMSTNQNQWCIISIPTKAWAKKLLPGGTEDEQMVNLWFKIFQTMRLYGDAEKNWDEHKVKTNNRLSILNSKQFDYLHFKNKYGTDLKVELPDNHIWYGCGDKTPEGIEFIPNMPTEEVYTAPKKTGINGILVSSKPLCYNGNIIDKFKLEIKNGEVIKYTAEVGEEYLKNIIELDDNAKFLGEIALVQYNSPISKLDTLFYNTLFDENASCHFAFGNAYPICIKNGGDMDEEELSKNGLNTSIVHEDFMVGTDDLSIIGYKNNESFIIFNNGNFVF